MIRPATELFMAGEEILRPITPSFAEMERSTGTERAANRRCQPSRPGSEPRPKNRHGSKIGNFRSHRDLGADRDRSRVGADSRRTVGYGGGFSSARTGCTPEAPASVRAAHPSATPRDASIEFGTKGGERHVTITSPRSPKSQG